MQIKHSFYLTIRAFNSLMLAHVYRLRLIVEPPLPFQDMPANAHPVRIALLTDVHIGPTVGKKRVERIVKLTNSIHPGLVEKPN